MSDTWIKDVNGGLVARLRFESNGYQRLYTKNCELLGSYNPISNTTHYPNGAIFCCGNALTALVKF